MSPISHGQRTTGRLLGNYLLGEELGHGGAGAVFAAEHRFSGDAVAVKVLHSRFAENWSVTLRFFREARAARSIDHPHVIRVIDFGREQPDGDLYLVMELLGACREKEAAGDRQTGAAM